jgi:hypothetical protein
MGTMALKLQKKSSMQTPRLRLAYSAPEPDTSTIEELRRLTLSATKALPFVKLRANDQPLWRPESYWNVKTTGKRDTDLQLGRNYARKAIAAMKADQNNRLIALIVEDIIHDAVGRTKKKSRPCPVAVGFLNEISQSVAAAS